MLISQSCMPRFRFLAVNSNIFFVFPSYLIIVSTADNNIVRYNVEFGEIDILNTTGYFPHDVSVDDDNGVVYWVNFDLDSSSLRIMSTTYANETTDLGLVFDDGSRIRIDQDQLHLYILEDLTIRKYVKSTIELQTPSITVPSGTMGIEIAFGKSIHDLNNWNILL